MQATIDVILTDWIHSKVSALRRLRLPMHTSLRERCFLTTVPQIMDNAVLHSEEATGKRFAGTSRALERTGKVSFAATLSSHSSSFSRVPGQLMSSKS